MSEIVEKQEQKQEEIKKKPKIWIFLIIGLVILFIGGISWFLGSLVIDNFLKWSPPEKLQETLPQSMIGSNSIDLSAVQVERGENIEGSIYPVKVIGRAVGDQKADLLSNGDFMCQPELFDPKTTVFYKVKLENQSPSELYKVEWPDGTSTENMMIDGWWNGEGSNKINLPEPFDVIVYNFGCITGWSHVLEITKDGERWALYTHVYDYNFSDDGKTLYLVNEVKQQGGFAMRRRIIDIDTKKAGEIPNLGCVSPWRPALWNGDRLLTYAEQEYGVDYQHDICIWDKSANLISRLSTTTARGASNEGYLAEQIGVLPNDPNIFYAYTHKDTNTCSLVLADITETNSYKSIDILSDRDYPSSYHCVAPEVKFDFSDVYFDRGILKYEIWSEDKK